MSEQTGRDEPEQITVTRYRCPHCSRSRSSKKAIVEHMARCWVNPAARGCKTCRHYFLAAPEPDVGYAGEEGCELDVPMPLSVRGAETLAVNCPKWEPNMDGEQ